MLSTSFLSFLPFLPSLLHSFIHLSLHSFIHSFLKMKDKRNITLQPFLFFSYPAFRLDYLLNLLPCQNNGIYYILSLSLSLSLSGSVLSSHVSLAVNIDSKFWLKFLHIPSSLSYLFPSIQCGLYHVLIFSYSFLFFSFLCCSFLCFCFVFYFFFIPKKS